MDNQNQTSRFELLIETLELALTATNDNDLTEMTFLAAQLSDGFSNTQIEKAKSKALKNVRISEHA